MINQLIRNAVEKEATNIHIAPGAGPLIRVNGKVKVLDDEQIMSHDHVMTVLNELCTEVQLDALNQNGELYFGYSIPEVGRFRVNVLKQRGSYSLSIRILKLVIPDKSELGLPEHLYELLEKGQGLFLVSGASGTGRSTTIASLIQHINSTKRVHIMTIESPIEYLFKHDKSIVIQRDVGTDCVDFYEGLSSAMLHDPDVIMISEINTERMQDLALRLAEAGKLVIAGYSGVNTISALGGFLFSEQAERKQIRKHKLASVLLGIISQQLVPSKDQDIRLLGYELLLMNNVVRSNIISDNLAEIQNTLIAGRRQGMVSMDACLYEMFSCGAITKDTLYRYCTDTDVVKRLEKSLI